MNNDIKSVCIPFTITGALLINEEKTTKIDEKFINETIENLFKSKEINELIFEFSQKLNLI